MSCKHDNQFRNRPDFVAVHESPAGPKRRFRNFRQTVTIGGEADIDPRQRRMTR